MIKHIAIILAGGIGTRVGADVPKQFVEVFGKPVLAYTLEIFQNNPKIDAIEVVCHKDWHEVAKGIVAKYNISKVRWIVDGGKTFQDSTLNGVFSLKGELAKDDIVVISFGVSPLTPQEDIDDSIRVCEMHGNAISSKDIDLCTCIKDNEDSTSTNLIRETIKGFANPWTFRYGELLEAYEYAINNNILYELEPHTTSLYFALGKRLWFSQCSSPSVKITTKKDLELFKGFLLLKKYNEEHCDK